MKLIFDLRATYFQAGDKFHPAVAHAGEIYYWPNITHNNAVHAAQAAQRSIQDVTGPARALAESWNVWPAPRLRADGTVANPEHHGPTLEELMMKASKPEA